MEFQWPLRRYDGESGIALDYRPLRVALKCDFKQLDYLAENAVEVPPGGRLEVKLLVAYFRLLLFLWAVRHRLRLRETEVILEQEEVLGYIANLVGRETQIMRLECAGEP